MQEPDEYVGDTRIVAVLIFLSMEFMVFVTATAVTGVQTIDDTRRCLERSREAGIASLTQRVAELEELNRKQNEEIWRLKNAR